MQTSGTSGSLPTSSSEPEVVVRRRMSVVEANNPFHGSGEAEGVEVGGYASVSAAETIRMSASTFEKFLRSDPSKLRLLLDQMEGENGLEIGTRLYLKKMYYNCFSGEEFVNWIRRRDNGITDSALAKIIGQGLLANGHIISLCGQTEFEGDSAPYKTSREGFQRTSSSTFIAIKTEDLSSDPQWFKELDTVQSTMQQEKTDSFEASALSEDISSSQVGSYRTPSFQVLSPKGENEAEVSLSDDQSKSNFVKYYANYVDRVASLLLSAAELEELKWKKPVLDLVKEIVASVKPNYRDRGDLVDIREYVKIKKVAGGTVEECVNFSGEVFTGRILKKGMHVKVRTPKIMLICGSLSFHRSAGKYVSLINMSLQEDEYIKNICSRIKEIGPHVILIEKSLSGLALEILDKDSIVTIVNVKPHVLQRLARYLDVDVLSSIGSLLETPQTGAAEMYRNEIYQLPDGRSKSLVFVQSPKKNLGCTVLLRGGPMQELIRVKAVIRRLLLLESNAKYERELFFYEHGQATENTDLKIDCLSHTSLSPYVIIKSTNGKLRLNDKRKMNVKFEEAIEQKCTPINPGTPEQCDMIDLKLSSDILDDDVEDLLANFRASTDLYVEQVAKQMLTAPEKQVERELPSSLQQGLDIKPFAVLFSSFAPSTKAAPYHCVIPWIINMQFYGKNDLPLGAFLETFCFSSSYVCPNSRVCGSDMSKHVRRFCHGQKYLKLTVQCHEEPLVPSSNNEDTTMWKHCKICKLSTPPRPLNYNMYMYSFTMFLFIHFYDEALVRRGRSALECQHSLHRDHVTCFSRGNETAVFECLDLKPFEVCMPSPVIYVPETVPKLEDLEKEKAFLAIQGPTLFSNILNEIVKLKQQGESLKKEDKIQQLLIEKENDYAFFRELQRSIETNVAANDYIKSQDLAFKAKHFLGDCVQKWRKRLAILHDYLKRDRSRANSGTQSADGSRKSDELPPLAKANYESVLPMPFPANMHFNVGQNQRFPVDEKQPSSIIAHVLGSADYEDFLRSSSTVISAANAKPQENDKLYFEKQFNDETCKFFCCAYYARQFHDFRLRVMDPQCDFVASISKCRSWLANGGKSGMAFYKTLDDRFILKEMSSIESKSFHTFVPHYLEYIIDAKESGRPSCLAKIVGVFKIGYKNTQTNASFKMELLIIENVFYGRKISKQFDLKGSNRNRLVDESLTKLSSSSLVLLDENLQKEACENPLYITLKSKHTLLEAIDLDSQFLASNSMMDYSLLVGKDLETSELVLGIIDYIRTFTWDKKFETLVKSSGILGGGGKVPTVCSPHLYMNRFRDAMYKYFILVPDIWYTDANTYASEGAFDISTVVEETSNAEEEKENNFCDIASSVSEAVLA